MKLVPTTVFSVPIGMEPVTIGMVCSEKKFTRLFAPLAQFARTRGIRCIRLTLEEDPPSWVSGAVSQPLALDVIVQKVGPVLHRFVTTTERRALTVNAAGVVSVCCLQINRAWTTTELSWLEKVSRVCICRTCWHCAVLLVCGTWHVACGMWFSTAHGGAFVPMAQIRTRCSRHAGQLVPVTDLPAREAVLHHRATMYVVVPSSVAPHVCQSCAVTRACFVLPACNLCRRWSKSVPLCSQVPSC